MATKGPGLLVTHPEIALDWHPTKNGSALLSDATAHSKYKAWWLCHNNGEHEWQQRIDQRIIQGECGSCALEKRSLLVLFPEIAKQWNDNHNGELRPNMVTGQSSKKVWWQCPLNVSHQWSATVANRTSLKQGCPYCKGKRVDNTNSLAALRPDLAKEWHPRKNIGMEPGQYTCGSHQKVWWLCSTTGRHEWQAMIKARALRGDGCPECSQKRLTKHNLLSVAFPEIASEWHPTKNRHLYPPWFEAKYSNLDNKRPKNRRLRPSDVPAYGSEFVWWRCKKNPKHEWNARIAARTKNGTGCPYCAGRLVSEEYNLEKSYPSLAKLWHPTRNGKLLPSQVTPGSTKKVWWRCFKSATHIWQAQVCAVVWSRKEGTNGCPYCCGHKVGPDNSLLAKNPDAAKMWHPKLNLPLKPSAVTASSQKIVWWLCSTSATHEFQAPVKSVASSVRKGHSGCPYCKSRRVSDDNSFASNYPKLLTYWNFKRNRPLFPSQISKGSSKLVWWICPKSGKHVWQRTVSAMVTYWKRNGALCPFCLREKSV